jgi:hypothetical protein
MNSFVFEGQTYNVADLSKHAKVTINNLNYLRLRINETNNLMSIYEKAKGAGINDLRNEIIFSKVGISCFQD